MVIDYSKWDRMAYDDDDDDGDVHDDDNGTPRVTSLDRPGRVTIGPTGSTIELLGGDDKDDVAGDDLPSQTSNLTKSQAVAICVTNDGNTRNDNGDDMKRHDKKRTLLLTRNGGMHLHTLYVPDREHDDNDNSSPRSTNIGGSNKTKEGREIIVPIYWSQDRYAVTLRLGIDPTVFAPRNIRVRCKGALPYSDRHSAVGSGGNFGGEGESHGSIEIVCMDGGKSRGGGGDDERRGRLSAMAKSSSTVILLSERLYRPIYLNEGEDELDFEIEDCSSDDLNVQNCKKKLDCGDGEEDPQKYQQQQQVSTTNKVTKLVTIVLPKAVPMIGMTYWWDRLFVGYPTIDMDTIIIRSERKVEDERNNSDDGIDPRTKKGEDGKQRREGEAFRKAWEGAHASFREKMKTRERQSIDIGE